MSDIEPVLDTGPPLDTAPILDPELERLLPIIIDAAKLAVAEAAATTPTTTYRPASVTGIDPALRNASVLCDGDTSAITAQLLCEMPGSGDRVMVEFRGGGAVFVTGFITACGEQAGFCKPYAGPITQHAGGVSGSATPGEPPRGWLWCAGQAVSRSTYPALYLAIGDTWGAGDGATTFLVPDFRGRDLRGLDNMGGSDAGRIGAANTLGGTGGTGTISTAMLPAHTHDLANHTHPDAAHTHSFSATTSSDGNHQHGDAFGGSNVAAGATGWPASGSSFDQQTSVAGAHTHTLSGTTGGTSGGSTGTPSNNTSGSTGSGSEFLPPYALVHWLIKA